MTDDQGQMEALEKIDALAMQVHELVDELKIALQGNKVTAKLQELINTFDQRFESYIQASRSGSDFDKIMRAASHLKTYAQAISSESTKITTLNDVSRGLTKNLSDLSKTIEQNIDHREVLFSSNEESVPGPEAGHSESRLPEINSLKKGVSDLKADLRRIEERQEKRQSAASVRLDEIELTIEKIEGSVRSKLEAADSIYKKAEEELQEKQESVDHLLGTISAGVIAKDYEASATIEKKMADWLRYGSLGSMTLIAFLVGFSLYETTTDNFKWVNSIFRIIFTILLSIPAAYLARESAKHRQQQYIHLQTSLDLKAITPYLASLPLEEQHRIKSEIAHRIFAPRDFSTSPGDPSPINTQELLMKLIDKMELRPKGGVGVSNNK